MPSQPPSNPTEVPISGRFGMEREPDPCLMVIFGASGDLTQRKLIPALYDLSCAGVLPVNFTVVGTGRTPMSDDAFRAHLMDGMRRFGGMRDCGEESWAPFAGRLHYVSSNMGETNDAPRLKELLLKYESEFHTRGNILFYLATPPSMYEPIIRNIERMGLHVPRMPGAWVRIVIEKPYGSDLESMRHLNAEVLRVFTEDQVYRIDHYMGKETVQNLVVFRFANGIFEPIWNRNYIDNIQITAAETVGVENRGSYYEEAGTLRDMVQNHMLQVLAMTAMEPPVFFDARQVRDEKQKVFQAIRRVSPEDVHLYTVRGQYADGVVGGNNVPSYRSEQGVAHDSTTETFVALKLAVDNWRWAGVPFYIRSGKRMPERLTEIAVQFKKTPHHLFTGLEPDVAHNSIVIRIQPNEGISLRFTTKIPGSSLHMRPVDMD